MSNNIVGIVIRDLPKDLLEQIPEEYHDREISVMEDYSKSETGSEVIKLLNRRWVFTQLGLELQETDHREIFYTIRKIFAKRYNKLETDEDLLDIGGNFDQQYISFTGNMIEGYYRKLAEYLGFEYWGFVMEYLNITSQSVARLFDLNLDEYVLDLKTLTNKLPKSLEIPFFLIICEKKMTVDITMKGLIEKGYDKGFYGITLSRFATTHVIKYLLELNKLHRLHIFILHDMDLSGLMIYFNIKQWINCESVGINPDFLENRGLDYEKLYEYYKPKNKAKLIKGVKGMIEKLLISEEDKDKYKEWVKLCLTQRIELNSLTALRELEDFRRNKAIDFVEYIIEKVEQKIWDLNRYKKPNMYEVYKYIPSVNRPDYIDDIIEEIKDKAMEEIYKYLESINLRYNDDWKLLIEDDYNKIVKGITSIREIQNRYNKILERRFLRKNKRYEGSLLEVDREISNQDNDLYNQYRRQSRRLKKICDRQEKIFKRLIMKKPEFTETKERLEGIRDIIMDTLEDLVYDLENGSEDQD